MENDLETLENQKNDQKSSLNKKLSLLKEVILFAIIAFGIVMPFRKFIAEPYIVSGSSMFPTFKTGNYLIVDKISYRFEEPKRFDVIVLAYPKDTSRDFLKRIIGLPNEIVKIENGKVTIINDQNTNGFVLSEDYVQLSKMDNMEFKLNSDEYFVMGDNRRDSFDSRYFGTVPRIDVLGKPIARLFPFNNIDLKPGFYKQNEK